MNKSKRKHQFINTGLQNRLIISLVVFELLLISLAVYFIYQDISQIIEDNMFRSHIQNSLSLEYFVVRVLQAMFVLLMVNVVIASLVVWRWRGYVNSIVQPLEGMIASIHRLDFSDNKENTAQHEALAITKQWKQKENECFTEIRQNISGLSPDGSANMTEALTRCRHLIEDNNS